MRATRGPWLGLFARQIIRDITVHVSLTVAAGLLLFMAIDTVETGNMASNADDAFTVMQLELKSLPVVFQQIATIAVLVGTCTAIGALVRRGEVVAMLSAGGPPSLILRPALIAGLLWALAFAAITQWVAPTAHAEIRRLRRVLGIPSGSSDTMDRGRKWFTGRERIFRVGDLEDPEGRVLAGVLILDVEQGSLRERWDVERLVWADGAGWTAQGVVRRRWQGSDQQTTSKHDVLPLDLAETPEDFVRSVGAPERLSLGALWAAVTARARLGQPVAAHTLELYRRITQPLTLLAALACAAALMLLAGRRPTLASALGVGALLGFSLWLIDELSVALATTSAVSAPIAAMAPLGVTTLLAGAAWSRAYRRGITD